MSCKKKCKPCEVVKPCVKKRCDEKTKCVKKCSSSSSSSSCDEKKCCIPKIVYQACINGGVASLSVTVTAPSTYTCPTQICQKLPLTITVTNTGNASIKSPVYIFSNFTGVKKITCKKLLPNETVTATVFGKVSRCDCVTGANISFSLVAYAYLAGNAIVLVSSPVGVVINQTTA